MDNFALNFIDISSILVFAVVGLITFLIVNQCRRPNGLPPGPPILPFVGNMPAISGKNLIEAFRELRKQYGDIFCLRLGSSWVLVINGYKNLQDALIKQGDDFQDRPNTFVFDRLLDKKGIIGSSGLLWQENRHFAVNTLKDFGFGKRSLQDKILSELEYLLNTLQSTNGENFDLKPIIQGVFSNTVLSLVFNQRYEYDEPEMLKVRDILHENLSDSECAGLLSFMPWLEYLPGDRFRAKRLLKIEKILDSFMQKRIDEHKQTIDHNNHRDFLDAYLSEMKKRDKDKNSNFTERQLVRTCRDLLLAGTDTTATSIRWAILHLIHKPEIQEKMFKEIKEKIGLDRLPDMNDRKEMPYCDAVCYETMRISDVAPVSIPRITKTETHFKGYTIPANTFVFPCLDSVLLDGSIFPNPENFIPERFLDVSSLNKMTKFVIPFALGKRSCPGEVLARQEIFLTLVSLVRRFKFLPPKELGMPEIKRKFGVIFYPAEYKLRAVSRDSL